MSTGMKMGKMATGATGIQRVAPLSRCTTTLYDLIAALQAMASPDDDALVVAAVAHLLRSGRLTMIETASTLGRRTP